MELNFSAAIDPAAQAIAFAVGAGGVARLAAELGAPHGDVLAAAAAHARFDGEAGAVCETAALDGGRALRLILVGVGDGGLAHAEKAGGALTARLLTSGTTSVAVDFAASGGDSGLVLNFAMGAKLRAWRHDRYRTTLADKAKISLKAMQFVSAHGDLAPEFAGRAAVAAGVAFAQELVTEPGNVIFPESFVAECQHLADLGVGIEVLDERQMAALGMGALLGVAQGSVRAPRLLVMRWMGGTGDATPLVLVGKGVTFDSGGISLKPGAGMDMMKWDMGGAGAVAGAMKALAGRRARANVIGICGLVENMPDGNAQRPGDVVTSMSGQTIEILNTDAEGRLVLCDCLTYAQREFSPEVIVDLATLTGAMIVALGHEHGGLFANDDGLAADLLAAGLASGNPLWRFPLSAAYDRMIDSPIADMKNVGPRDAGSITAAQFLGRYINAGVKWAHLDIAGMVWADKDGPVWGKGATGYGVRLLDQFVAAKFEG